MSHTAVHHLFSRVAARLPDATAVAHGGRRLAYGQLEDTSNRLAGALRGSGAAKGSVVGILSDDPFEVIAAILGVLKAGCVFVPLEPSIPRKRLQLMTSIASPGWFVAGRRFEGRIAGLRSGDASRPVVISPESGQEIVTSAFQKETAPRVPAGPDDMCYIYFTSGSSGTPKGIAGRLKAIDQFIRWEIETFGIGRGTRISQLTSPSFDAYLRDVFVPLCAGGTVCVPESADTLVDGRKLLRWIDEEEINLVHCVPSVFRMLLDEDLAPERFPRLRYVLLAGEPLLPADVAGWVRVFGRRIPLVNLYGPSETTMVKFAHFVKPSDAGRRSVPIGRPIPGARALVLDRRLRPCPPGVIGEICIRTPYCTLGYYKRPELTREVFIPNPYTGDPHDTIYKTGDLGRLLEDGTFEILGRKDQQVKIRGVRVELSEIEAVLRGHEHVKEVAVVDRTDGRGNKFLSAYVVLTGPVASGELRDFVSDHLPGAMVPSAFLVMDALPRTHTGKLDRRSLPDGHQQDLATAKYVAPRTPDEERLAQIWGTVLERARVGVCDNWFEIGGHSLLAAQLLSRVRKAFNADLPMQYLFAHPTVAGMAEQIRVLRWAARSGQEDPAGEDWEEVEL